MARVTPQQMAEKWSRRTAAATQDYVAGIQRVTEAPGIAAAQKQDKYLAGVQEAVSSGKWADRVSSVPLADWKRLAAEKGAPRIAAGVQGAQSKYQRFAAEFLPFLDGIVAAVEQMDDTTLEARIQRSVEFQRRAAGFRRS